MDVNIFTYTLLLFAANHLEISTEMLNSCALYIQKFREGQIKFTCTAYSAF